MASEESLAPAGFVLWLGVGHDKKLKLVPRRCPGSPRRIGLINEWGKYSGKEIGKLAENPGVICVKKVLWFNPTTFTT